MKRLRFIILLMAFDLIINVLYNGKSEEYKKMLEELEQNGVSLHGQGQR